MSRTQHCQGEHEAWCSLSAPPKTPQESMWGRRILFPALSYQPQLGPPGQRWVGWGWQPSPPLSIEIDYRRKISDINSHPLQTYWQPSVGLTSHHRLGCSVQRAGHPRWVQWHPPTNWKVQLNVCCEYSQIIVVIDEKRLFLVRSKNRRKRSTLSPQCLQLCFDIIGHCLVISGIFSIAYLNEKEMGTNISCRIQIVLRQIQVFITSFLGCRSQTDTSSTHSFLAFLNNLASCANAFTYFFNFGFSKVSALT